VDSKGTSGEGGRGMKTREVLRSFILVGKKDKGQRTRTGVVERNVDKRGESRVHEEEKGGGS